MKRIEFNDGWSVYKEGGPPRKVSLPHDAMLEEERSPGSPSGSAGAYFPGGKYIYEKKFTLPEGYEEKKLLLEFEGVYKNAEVYLNDQPVGGCAYGYSPFWIDLDGALDYSGENTIRVIADNEDLPNSRWYTGSGIYRPVWLWVGGKKHIRPDGIKISTLSYEPARIRIEVEHEGGEAAAQILYQGKAVAEGRGSSMELEIPGARLWSDETPELYQCRVVLSEEKHGKDKAVLDEAVESFGIRLVEWSNQGLFVNGKETLLRGGCVHHDNGILGARSYAKSEERRVRILKEAGFNAIRSSHNPASKAMLEACDRVGMYVMDETWDMWYSHKSKFDYAKDFMANYKYDIKAMVDRDFNHPSVILYSICNEVAEPAQEKGVTLAKEMVEYIHQLDKNRAVTCGINLMILKMASKGKGIYKEGGGREDEKKQLPNSSTLFNLMTSMVGTGMNKSANSKAADLVTSPCLEVFDIAGYNYASGRYPLEGKAHPDRVILGSETFPQDIGKNWSMVKKYSYLVGDFMWTAWDYLGEVGLGAWAYTEDGRSFDKPYPWLLAEAGAFDILGNENAEAGYAATVWGVRKTPYIGVRPVNHPGIKPAKAVWRGTNALPSWSWQGCEGNQAIVEVYADSAKVELFLNEKSLGKKKIKDYKVVYKTKYAPGKLKAVAYDGAGRKISQSELISAAGKLCISASAEEATVSSGDIAYINIELTGENGILECNADRKLKVTVEGGELLAFGSANPRTKESFLSGSYTTYYGRAQAVVKAAAAGKLQVQVTGEGLKAATAVVTVK
ncbi:MAG TPA: glycoside hydrolase family 2 protein [Clostridiales bacterium]|nr:glycoside hydrolase family 2 protein [Clostridiales bacterium]